MNRGAWRTAVHGVAKSRKRLSDQHFHLTLILIPDFPEYQLSLWFDSCSEYVHIQRINSFLMSRCRCKKPSMTRDFPH